MYRYGQVFPVLPGKSDEDAKSIARYFSAHPDEYWESRRAAGMTLERVYLQKTPMGSFVVAYVEGEHDIARAFELLGDMSKPVNQKFAELVKEVHGFDLTKPMAGPMPETIGEWRDEMVNEIRQGFGFLFPLLPGKAETTKAFAREAYANRRSEFAVSRRGWDETAEVVTLLHTPMGEVVAGYLEGRDPVEANRQFAASDAPFDRWFKDELKKVVPPEIDFYQPIPGVEEIFDSQKLAAKS